jgi:hypothetical protein
MCETRRSRFIVVILLLVWLLADISPIHRARAAGVVGTGTPASCNEAALDTALAGGGNVTFNCGSTLSSPVTIVITSTKLITIDTLINGGTVGLIKISGQNGANRVRIFQVNALLTINNLIVADGLANNSMGGAIYNNGGGVVITNSSFLNNQATGALPNGKGGRFTIYRSLEIQTLDF